MRIVALDAAALAQGLAPGLTLADARARIPELAAVDYDPLADRLWLERLADGCDRWTPMVALDPPDGITLDITGCLEAHALSHSVRAAQITHPVRPDHFDESTLAADIERRFARAGIPLRLAIADTPEAAQALARYQTRPGADERQAIRRLPVAALRLDEEQETALRRAGLKTIGDLSDRPLAPLAARFGEAMVDALDRLLGRADSRIVPRRALPPLLFERRFAEPIARTEDALAVLDELMHEAALALEERRGGGRRFVGRLYRSDGAVRDLSVETGLPTRDPAVPARLFRERIEALADPIDPGFGFDMIRLAVPLVEPLAAGQLGLEGRQRQRGGDGGAGRSARHADRPRDASAASGASTRIFPSKRRSRSPRSSCPIRRAGQRLRRASRRSARCTCSIRHSRSRWWHRCPMGRRAASAGAARCTR